MRTVPGPEVENKDGDADQEIEKVQQFVGVQWKRTEDAINDHPDWNDEQNGEEDAEFMHCLLSVGSRNLPGKTQTARRELRGRRGVI